MTGIVQFAHPCSFSSRKFSKWGRSPSIQSPRAATHSDTHYDGWRTAGINIAGTFVLDVLAGTPSRNNATAPNGTPSALELVCLMREEEEMV